MRLNPYYMLIVVSTRTTALYAVGRHTRAVNSSLYYHTRHSKAVYSGSYRYGTFRGSQ